MISTSPATTAASGTTAQSSTPATSRRVVDAPIRMFHWLFALTFAGAYVTAESEHWRLLHVTQGYAFAGLLGFRLLYGVFGPRHARLGLMWRRVAGAPAWLRSLRSARSAPPVNWRQGQNLTMALLILTMLALVAPLVLSGYGAYNDRGEIFGGDLLEEVHEFFGNVLFAVVIAHLGLIAGLSLLRRQNQALPMLTGHVHGNGPSLVRHNRAWLAALLLLSVAVFVAWQWFDSPRGLLPSSHTGAESNVLKHGEVRGQRHEDDD